MPRKGGVTMDWNGKEIMLKGNRAAGRSLVAIAEQGAAMTKRGTHVGDTGTLRRSVHAAKAGYDGGADEGTAASGADIATRSSSMPQLSGLGSVEIELGSWISYAATEFVRRGHDPVTPAIQGLRAYAVAAFVRAFKEEGL